MYEPMRAISHSNHNSGEFWELLDGEREACRDLRMGREGAKRTEHEQPRRWKAAREVGGGQGCRRWPRREKRSSSETQVLTWLMLRAQKVVLGRVGGLCGFYTHSLPGMGGGEKGREKVEGPFVAG